MKILATFSNGEYTTGRVCISSHDASGPRVWFEFMHPTLSFSDSLAFSQVFPEVKR